MPCRAVPWNNDNQFLREMNGNGIFRIAAFYKGIVASVAGAAICSVGSGLVYLSIRS